MSAETPTSIDVRKETDVAPENTDVALMFSGGLDSSAAALELARQYRRVHLLTYRNGFGHFFVDRSRQRAAAIREALKDTPGAGEIVHEVLSTRDHFDQLLVKSAVADFKEYKSGFIWCMGCKLAMHARSAAYCLENGITKMTDGSNSGTDEMVEQSLLSLSMVRAFYKRFDIDFFTPVYEQTREQSRKTLEKLGVRTGFKVMDRHLGVQPTCVAGELYYMPYLLFNKRVKHEDKVVMSFIAAKMPIAEKLVREGT